MDGVVTMGDVKVGDILERGKPVIEIAEQQQFPPCPKDPIRPMPEGSPGASFGSQKPCVTLPSKREAKRGAIPCNVGFPFG
jgi:hypothetical protein